MASRIFASEPLINWVSSASSNVFWLSFNISDSRVTVLPSPRPETADRSTARPGLRPAICAASPLCDRLAQLGFEGRRDVQALVIGRFQIGQVAGDGFLAQDGHIQHLFRGHITWAD